MFKKLRRRSPQGRTKRWLRQIVCLAITTTSTLSCAKAVFDHGALTENSVAMSTEQFFRAFMHDDPQQRDRARMYLLGVMDSSEGVTWCDYTTYKLSTLQGRIYEALKNANETQLSQQAALTLTQILEIYYPCRSQK